MINKDIKQLKKTVQFPLRGNWGSAENQSDGQGLNSTEFFKDLNVILSDDIIKSLQETDYRSFYVFIDTADIVNAMLEIDLTTGEPDHYLIGTILFTFQSFNGKWMLNGINVTD
jgi:hypothetical protein